MNAKKFLNKTSFAPDPLLYNDNNTRNLTFSSKNPIY